MLGLGMIEIFFLLIVLLCLFSPKEIPELARLVLKGIYEVKNVFSKLEKKMSLNEEHLSLKKNKNLDKQKKNLRTIIKAEVKESSIKK